MYSATIAAARNELAKLMVTVVPAPETLGADQIVVVEPLALAACVTRDQVAPVWLIEETWLVVVPRVEITATRVFPSVGAVRVTVNEVT